MDRRPPLAILLVALLATLCTSCSEDLFDGESDLVILNDSGCAIRVVVDGHEAFAVKPGADRILDDIGTGRHVLEALDANDQLLERRTVELANGEDFYWTLDHC